jgi:hypothetical protein
MTRFIALAAFCLSLVLVGVAYASLPSGIYVLVEEVELGPQVTQPQWIRIRGVFMNEPSFDESPPFPNYGPVRGWANFGLPKQKQKQDLARREWKDFADSKGKVVAFGSAYAPILRTTAVAHFVRADANAAKARQKEYPVEHGMYLIRDDSKPAKALIDFRDKALSTK